MNKTLTIKTQLSLKLFLTYSLMLFVALRIINYMNGEKTEILTHILMSLVSAFLISWFSTKLTLNLLKRNGISELDKRVLKVYQVEMIQKAVSIAQLSKLLKQDDKTKKWKQRVNGTTIKIKTKISAQSWGEIILITTLENQVRIESKPRLITTIFDSGKNLVNVKTIKDSIEKNT